jgi:RHS repeat-associated protein
VKYLLDMQPGLAYVIGVSEGSRYVHAPRGIHAAEDQAGNWQHVMTDALGSVRGYVGDHNRVMSNVNYSEYGVPSTPITGFAFTGEWRDQVGVQYHRARYLSPALGGWLSLDPWEGMVERAMSLNGYAWVEGNVSNKVDPSGLVSCMQTEFCEQITRFPGMSRIVLRAIGCLPPLINESELRTSITAGLGSPADDVVRPVGELGCQQFTRDDDLQACQTLQRIQQEWPDASVFSGPTIGELVALVIGTEWYVNRGSPGDSGIDDTCQQLLLGEVMEIAMANQFWFFYRSDGYLANIVRYLAYFEPIREQQVAPLPRGSLFTATGGVPDLIRKEGRYAEGDLLGYLNRIFSPDNPFRLANQGLQGAPNSAVLNCPFGFANIAAIGEVTESYAINGVIAQFPDNFNVISFAQETNQQPSQQPCGTLERLRSRKRCQPQPLGGLE